MSRSCSACNVMRLRQLGLVAVVTLLASLAAAAPVMGQVSVIANSSVQSAVTQAQITEIFAGALRAWPTGAKIYVADQSETEVGRSFYDTVMRRPTSVVRMQWIQLILSGQAVAPRRMQSDEAVIEFVRRTPGAVGYVRSSSLDGSVKELLRVDDTTKKP